MYYAHAHTTSRERVISGAFASTMHLLFIALLVFGVNWQKKVEPQVNVVDLWSPPSPTETKAVAPPPPAPEPPKPVVKPEPKVEQTPPKPVAKPEAAKPDIALKEKEKIEKERRVAEEKQKAEKKREVEAAAAQKSQQAEVQRLAKEQAEAQQAMASQAAAARKNELDKYRKGISDKIKSRIVRPPNLQGNEESEFDIVVLPDGNVLGVKLKKPSGNPAYDNAVERAISRAQPLPMPPDPALLKDFRELNLKFRAQE
ncbi:MAG TPA: cell envelope integrity protein TolA [Burkholderiales bacterium]|jgi:colicin import membrane protein|nr:cell envelope integrity protein TolA [Burkholderiales bacterium]